MACEELARQLQGGTLALDHRLKLAQEIVRVERRAPLAGEDDGNPAGCGIDLDPFGADGFASTPRARNLALGKSVWAARFLPPVGVALRGFGRRLFHTLLPSPASYLPSATACGREP